MSLEAERPKLRSRDQAHRRAKAFGRKPEEERLTARVGQLSRIRSQNSAPIEMVAATLSAMVAGREQP